MVFSELHKRIVKLEWNDAKATLGTDDGKKMASDASNKDGNLPLHLALERRAPEHIILSLIDVNPDAVAAKGKKDGSYPLHVAVQHSLPSSVIIALIRAYPEALDIANDEKRTPRDYNVKCLKSRQALHRPTSCWIEEIEKDDYAFTVRERKDELTLEISTLKNALAISREKREHISKVIALIEPRLSENDNVLHSSKLKDDRMQTLTDDIKTQLAVQKERIEALRKSRAKTTLEELMRSSEEKKASMEDARKKYESLLMTHDRIRNDLTSLRALV